jgi:hypothetical protein
MKSIDLDKAIHYVGYVEIEKQRIKDAGLWCYDYE